MSVATSTRRGLSPEDLSNRIGGGVRRMAELLAELEEAGLAAQEHGLWRLSYQGERLYGRALRGLSDATVENR